MIYRKDIDCLRGYSVLAVILYHFKIKYFEGGYIGVDIFFVISGYLITAIIIKDIRSNSFSFLNFYERRIRRLLPALLVVLALTATLNYSYFTGDENINFFKSILSVILFYSNYWFYKSGSYFEPINENNPLFHLWSLSVEEQFYLAFPVIFIFFYKKKLLKIFILFFLLSFFLANNGGIFKSTYPFYDGFNLIKTPDFGFYFTPTRMWELLSGSFAAIYLMQNKKKINLDKYTFFSIFGYFLVFLSFLFFDRNTLHPSAITLIPVIGTLLIILFKNNFIIFYNIINNRLILFTGLISYSLYLWHQPILNIYMNKFGPTLLKLEHKALIILVIFLMSALSYYFVEKPFRNKKNFNRKIIFNLFIFLIIFGVGTSAFFAYSYDYNKKIDIKLKNILSEINYYKKDHFKKCGGDPNNYISPKKACVIGSKNNIQYVFLGDSHMGILSHELSKELDKKGKGGILLTYNGCLPSVNIKVWNDSRFLCKKYYSEVLNYLKDFKDLKGIVLFYRWPFFLSGERFNNSEGGIEIGSSHYLIEIKKQNLPNKTNRINFLLNETKNFINNIYNINNNITIISSSPEMGWSVPEYLVKKHLKKKRIKKHYLSIDKKVFYERNKPTHKMMDELKDKYKLKVLYPENYLCNEVRCLAHIDGYPLFFDDDHLSSLGSNIISRKLIKLIN